MAVLDEHAPIAIEHDPARRAQGKRPLMVVRRHFLELVVLNHLQDPEAHGQDREDDRDQVLKEAQAGAGFPARSC